MGQDITLYELFQLYILSDSDLLEIGKQSQLEKITLVQKFVDNGYTKEIQISYGEGGWLTKSYFPK